jgi:hypothetical protein
MTRSRGLSLLLALMAAPAIAAAQDTLPAWLRDRGPGVRTSLLGSYVRHRELLIYPFYEYYSDHDLEYKPSELGYGPSQTDYRGKYRANEGIFFVGYGVGPDVALEFEAAVIDATLETSRATSSAAEVHESGLGDVEGQIRWRFQRETATRPEFFTYLGAVAPLQKDQHLIGTQTWEVFGGVGFVRGYPWGTLTLRASVEFAEGSRTANTHRRLRGSRPGGGSRRRSRACSSMRCR